MTNLNPNSLERIEERYRTSHAKVEAWAEAERKALDLRIFLKHHEVLQERERDMAAAGFGIGGQQLTEPEPVY